MVSLLRDDGYELGGAAAGADDRDPFAVQIVLMLPARGVKGDTGKVFHPRDIREAGCIELSYR